MNQTQISKVVERYKKLLPSIVYSEDQSIAWDNEYQRTEVAKILAIEAMEERIRGVDMVMGFPLDRYMRELREAIESIKSM